MPVKFPVTKMCPLHTDSPVLRSWCFSTVKWQLSFLDCFSIFSLFRLLMWSLNLVPRALFTGFGTHFQRPGYEVVGALRFHFRFNNLSLYQRRGVIVRYFAPKSKKVKKTIFRYPILSVSKLSHLSLRWRFRTPLIFTSRFALLNSQNECVGKIKEEEGPGNWSQK